MQNRWWNIEFKSVKLKCENFTPSFWTTNRNLAINSRVESLIQRVVTCNRFSFEHNERHYYRELKTQNIVASIKDFRAQSWLNLGKNLKRNIYTTESVSQMSDATKLLRMPDRERQITEVSFFETSVELEQIGGKCNIDIDRKRERKRIKNRRSE